MHHTPCLWVNLQRDGSSCTVRCGCLEHPGRATKPQAHNIPQGSPTPCLPSLGNQHMTVTYGRSNHSSVTPSWSNKPWGNILPSQASWKKNQAKSISKSVHVSSAWLETIVAWNHARVFDHNRALPSPSVLSRYNVQASVRPRFGQNSRL